MGRRQRSPRPTLHRITTGLFRTFDSKTNGPVGQSTSSSGESDSPSAVT